MNAFSSSVYQSLLFAFPEWKNIQLTDSELLELEIPSPHNSSFGSLIIQTTDDNSIWIRNHQPCTAYLIDSSEEMLELIHDILSDTVFWAVGYKSKKWYETTLLSTLTQLEVEKGVEYQILSWSGKHDQIIRI